MKKSEVVSSVIGLSAVAARQKLLSLSSSSSQVEVEPRPPSPSTTVLRLSSDDDESQPSLDQDPPDQDLPHKSSKRYFDSIPTQSPLPNLLPTNPSTPDTRNLISSSNQSTKLKNSGMKRRRQRATFSDPDCVSNWEPIWNGPQQNLIKPHPLVSSAQPYVLGLNPGESLIIRGTLKLSVLSGSIQINGAKLEAGGLDEPLDVFAPVSHPLPIVSLPESHLKSSPNPSNSNLPLNPSMFAAIIQLDDLHTGIQGLDQVWCSNGPKRPLWPSSDPHSVCGLTWDLILTLTPEVSHLHIPPSWASSLASLPKPGLNSRHCFLVQGQKSVGKSTFARLLLNSLLGSYERVALLDLDPGQPLFTPSTLVSLHVFDRPIVGPSFCHQAIPASWLRAHYLGELSPKDCPSRYIEAVQDLIELYRVEYLEEPPALTPRQRRRQQRHSRPSNPTLPTVGQRCADAVPLIVNTMGWTSGLGAELLTRIRELVQPTTTFAFERPDLDEPPSASVEILEPIGDTPLSLRLPPTDARTLNLLAYLYVTPTTPLHDPTPFTRFFRSWHFEQPLSDRCPYAVSSSKVEIELLDENIPRSHLGYVLNGSLVALCLSGPSRCLGLGLVRSVDASSGALFLLTPSIPSGSEEKVTLVKGHEPVLPLMVAVQTAAEAAAGEPVGPYVEVRGSVGAGGAGALVGAEKKRVRRNVMRWGQRT